MFKFKKFWLGVFIVFASYSVKSQTSVCPNWTKTDCNGNSRTLYNYLDSNQVVAMIFGMGCSSCTDAAGFFASLRSQYMTTHPGRFKVFYLDFFEGNTCANNVTPIVGNYLDAGFDSCAAELAAYTPASPMTFVVVVAGSSHEIIYSVKKYIFEFSDSVAIKSAIDGYLNVVGIKEVLTARKEAMVFPNPVHDVVNITGLTGEIISYSINDIKGNLISEINTRYTKQPAINLSGFDNGIYYIRVKYATGSYQNFKIIKQD